MNKVGKQTTNNVSVTDKFPLCLNPLNNFRSFNSPRFYQLTVGATKPIDTLCPNESGKTTDKEISPVSVGHQRDHQPSTSYSTWSRRMLARVDPIIGGARWLLIGYA